MITLKSALPFDLYRPIVELVSNNNDLASLSRVCRAMQTEAERALYAEISVFLYTEPIASLYHTPRVRPYVRRISIDHQADTSETLLPYNEFVPSLVNLEELHIKCAHHPLYEALAQSKLERLKEVIITLRMRKWVGGQPQAQPKVSDTTACGHLATFFKENSSIVRLYWNGDLPASHEFEILQLGPNGSLPNLTHISGEPAFLMHVLIGRPISYVLTLVEDEREERDLVLFLGESGKEMVSLYVSGLTLGGMKALIGQLPRLRFIGELYHRPGDGELVSLHLQPT